MFKEIYRYTRLTNVFTRKAVKGMLTYRWSFFINCISQALDYSVTFLLMWIMISAFDTMKGWNAYEVMLLYSFSLFSYGIAGTFCLNIMVELPKKVRTGEFDDILVKPVKVLPYLISSSFICNYIAHMTLSVIVMSVCFYKLHISFSFYLLLKIIGILFCGSLIYAGLFLVVSASAFVMTKIDSLFQIMYFFREVSYYPVSIFPKLIQYIVTIIVPYGFVNYYPLQTLLKKKDVMMLGNLSQYTFLVAILFFVFSCWIFYKWLKCYKSSGS